MAIKPHASSGSATVLALCAASAAAGAITGLIEAARDGDDMSVAADLHNADVVENLADALQSALLIERDAPHVHRTDDERELIGQMLATLARFLEGWA